MVAIEYTGDLLYKVLFTVLGGIVLKWLYDTRRRHRVGEAGLSSDLH